MSSTRRQRLLVLALAVLAPIGAHGCMRGCNSSSPPALINFSMFNQPKYKAQAASEFFYDGKTMRPPVPGTVARGQLRENPAHETGLGEDGQPIATSPVATDEALLARGADRFGIYCQPCHDERGEGKGVLFQRANVPTANLLEKKIQDQTDGALFDTITNGKGLMAGYRYPISAHDRWAIIAHMRVLGKKAAEEAVQ